MIVCRSRQSTSVLHELEALARLDPTTSMSAPLRQLVGLQARLRRNVRRQLEQDRPGLARLADSFTAREHRQLKLQASNDYRALLTPFPVWIGTLADLGRMLPMQRELFDLVLIDEASQIDPAGALPALQRARSLRGRNQSAASSPLSAAFPAHFRHLAS